MVWIICSSQRKMPDPGCPWDRCDVVLQLLVVPPPILHIPWYRGCSLCHQHPPAASGLRCAQGETEARSEAGVRGEGSCLVPCPVPHGAGRCRLSPRRELAASPRPQLPAPYFELPELPETSGEDEAGEGEASPPRSSPAGGREGLGATRGQGAPTPRRSRGRAQGAGLTAGASKAPLGSQQGSSGGGKALLGHPQPPGGRTPRSLPSPAGCAQRPGAGGSGVCAPHHLQALPCGGCQCLPPAARPLPLFSHPRAVASCPPRATTPWCHRLSPSPCLPRSCSHPSPPLLVAVPCSMPVPHGQRCQPCPRHLQRAPRRRGGAGMAAQVSPTWVSPTALGWHPRLSARLGCSLLFPSKQRF